jgi:tetratricopeptide (TPR) repeat protein
MTIAIALIAALACPTAAADEGQAGTVGDVRTSRHALWQAWISAPDPDEAPTALDEILARVAAIRTEKQEKPAAPASPAPAETPAATDDPKSGDERSAADVEAALERLRAIDPRQIADPVAVADALYQGGHMDEAFFFYEKALAVEKADAARAWALYQMACCRRQSDPEAASALYQRLAQEHPKSAWAPLAEFHQRLATWYETERPRETAQVETEDAKP